MIMIMEMIMMRQGTRDNTCHLVSLAPTHNTRNAVSRRQGNSVSYTQGSPTMNDRQLAFVMGRETVESRLA